LVAVLFTFLEGYNYIFAEIHGTSEGITGLCFVGIIIGLFMSLALVPLIYRWAKEEMAKAEEQGRDKIDPEFRLWVCGYANPKCLPMQDTNTHLAVLNARRLHRYPRQPLLDGLDITPRHFHLESTRRERLIRLRHSVYLHHKVRQNRFIFFSPLRF
jgi:hypothetical protein